MDHEPAVEAPKAATMPLARIFKDDKAFRLIYNTCKELLAAGRAAEAASMGAALLAIGGGKAAKRVQLQALLNGTAATVAPRAGPPPTRRLVGPRAPHPQGSFEAVRLQVAQAPHDNRGWNLLYTFFGREEKQGKFRKFLQHMRQKHPGCVPAWVIGGFQAALAGWYQGCLRDYLRAYRLQPQDPFLCLLIGTAFLTLASGSRLSNRALCVLQGFTFLYKFDRLTDHSQVSSYNLARAYHQLGLLCLALGYYQKVLAEDVPHHPIPAAGGSSAPPGATQAAPLGRLNGAAPGSWPSGGASDLLPVLGHLGCSRVAPGDKALHRASVRQLALGTCDLKREAAHNLALIYRGSAAPELARHVYRTYVRI